MSQPLISIIVAIYNVAPYLKECIQSILEQTYTNIEIILVDDGSTDDSGRICESLKDDRTKVIHQKNQGLSQARNSGIEASSGSYLLFVDGDDYISSTMVETLYNSMILENADMVISNFFRVTEKGVKIESKDPLGYEVFTPIQFLETLCGRLNYACRVVAWNKLYKREIFQTIRYPKGKIHEDEFVIVDIVLECKKIVVVPDHLYYYREREGSIMKSKWTIRRLDVVEAFFLRCNNYDSIPEIRKYSAYNLKRGIVYYGSYYQSISWKRDEEHKKRDMYLQKLLKQDIKKIFWYSSFSMKCMMLLMYINMFYGTRFMRFVYSIIKKK